MPVIDTSTLRRESTSGPLAQQIYNGLDCCVTFECWEEIKKLNNQDPMIYGFERALQAPALEMMLRGFKVNPRRVAEGKQLLSARIERLQKQLNCLSEAVRGTGLNPRSRQQLMDLFYSHMNITPIITSKKGQRKISMDRETLEKIDLYLHARPFVSHILAIREAAKKLEVLSTEIDPDGRMRTSYNIAGTETGRWSSSQSSNETGTNLQNITPELRSCFEADPGYKLVGIDLEQAESREVGWIIGVLFNDWSYYNACCEGDLHTTTARLVWPSLDWTGQGGPDREIANRNFYRHFSYRDMSKRGGHGTNYYGTPATMARHLKVPTVLMRDFQKRYFGAYPGISRWHQWVATEIQTVQSLTTVFGRQRHFFGRPNDDTTLREAIAYCPQSATADRLNLILWRIWRHMPQVQILAQVHDALYFQFPEHLDEREIVSEALTYFPIPIAFGDHQLVVPGEAKTGWNWGGFSDSNPDGLKKFSLKAPDSRRRSIESPILERIM